MRGRCDREDERNDGETTRGIAPFVSIVSFFLEPVKTRDRAVAGIGAAVANRGAELLPIEPDGLDRRALLQVAQVLIRWANRAADEPH